MSGVLDFACPGCNGGVGQDPHAETCEVYNRAFAALKPIVGDYYGRSGFRSNSMKLSMLQHMADRVARNAWDIRGREYGLMMIAWDWMTGGSTAASFAADAEQVLIMAGFEPCPRADF